MYPESPITMAKITTTTAISFQTSFELMIRFPSRDAKGRGRMPNTTRKRHVRGANSDYQVTEVYRTLGKSANPLPGQSPAKAEYPRKPGQSYRIRVATGQPAQTVGSRVSHGPRGFPAFPSRRVPRVPSFPVLARVSHHRVPPVRRSRFGKDHPLPLLQRFGSVRIFSQSENRSGESFFSAARCSEPASRQTA